MVRIGILKECLKKSFTLLLLIMNFKMSVVKNGFTHIMVFNGKK